MAEAERAFETLKACYTTAPVLTHPDTSLPFFVKVDASEVGVGPVLSKCSRRPPKLRPCAFYSKQLSHAQRNYDAGDRELLAGMNALRRGGTGWRGPNTLSWCGRTTATWST